MSKYDKNYYQKNRDSINKKNRDRNHRNYDIRKEKNRNLMRMFNISIDDYEYLFKKQNGLCAICGFKEDRKHRNGKTFSLAVDHNHITGKIRGLLCSRCNMAIGGLRDSVEIIEKALMYIKQ
jgi:hypothetical protein